MTEEQLYNKIIEIKEQLHHLEKTYWEMSTGFDTWRFWFLLGSLIIPLVFLYFTVDRKRLFEISFFGFTIHILWANTDQVLTHLNYFSYPHSFTYILPTGITSTTVLFPIVFMLVYQHCIKKEKNIFIYIALLNLVFAFAMGPLYVSLGFLEMNKGMNYVFLYLIDVITVSLAFVFVKLFKIMKQDWKADQ
ncbi:hypothetical protein [Oceanobacillus manasiensis]|uniref:hypothetical protein n=1 Tax=Oceanobacillus manasiensis TaxID=586413 RepID=UPI0005A9F0C2|nr:hypothetical protein [Oceanobacillus manasiensis]